MLYHEGVKKDVVYLIGQFLRDRLYETPADGTKPAEYKINPERRAAAVREAFAIVEAVEAEAMRRNRET